MFLRSIRRRLSTGFTVVLALLVALASVGSMGLFWHQQALDELMNVLHRNPDRNALFTRLMHVEHQSHLVTSATSISPQVIHQFQLSVRKAVTEVDEFQLKLEELPPTPQLQEHQHHIINGLVTMRNRLFTLYRLSDQLAPTDKLPADEQQAQLQAFGRQTADGLHQLTTTLTDLPSWDDNNIAVSLDRERRLSRRLLYAMMGIAAGTVIAIGVISYYGFQWVSTPLITISKGASRIAEGDPDYRVPRVSRWEDEYTQLRDNVNLMAERFQEAEKDLNNKVRERSSQLVRSDRLANLGILAAGVAHEINNPLSIIRVATDVLDFRLHDAVPSDHPDRDEIFERLSMVRNEAARCGQITARTLDFARGEQGNVQEGDLTEMVAAVLNMVRPMPDYRDREIVFERDKRLLIRMNPDEIKQVLINLIFNALQATETNGRIEIRLIDQCDSAIIEVQDNGCGMSSETLHQLFDPFYSTKSPGQGTGLGMSITHRIIADHQGTIEPFSDGVGQGSLFRVRLPLRQPQRGAA